MLRVLHLGPFALQTSLFVLLIGFALSLEFIGRTTRYKLNHQVLQNGLIWGLVVGLLGARATYIGLNWYAYHDNLASWYAITPQALNTFGGLLVGAVVFAVYIRYRDVPWRPALDTLAPGFGLMAIAVNLAFLAEGDYFGTQTDLPWAVELWGAERHPTQLYAVLGGAITLGVWLLWWRMKRDVQFAGQGFLIVLAGNALSWLLVSFSLAEPVLVLDSYRRVQVVMWIVLIITAFVWNVWADAATSSQTGFAHQSTD